MPEALAEEAGVVEGRCGPRARQGRGENSTPPGAGGAGGTAAGRVRNYESRGSDESVPGGRTSDVTAVTGAATAPSGFTRARGHYCDSAGALAGVGAGAAWLSSGSS